MAFEKMIHDAFEESRNNSRLGDTTDEINEIKEYIKNAKKIYVPNKNGIKVKTIWKFNDKNGNIGIKG